MSILHFRNPGLNNLTLSFPISIVLLSLSSVSLCGFPLHWRKISSNITCCHFSNLAGCCFAGGSFVSGSVAWSLGIAAGCFLLFAPKASRNECRDASSFRKSRILIHDSFPAPLGSEAGGHFSMSVNVDFYRLIYFAKSERATLLSFQPL